MAFVPAYPVALVQNEEDITTFIHIIAEAFSHDVLNRYFSLGRALAQDHANLGQNAVRVQFWQPIIRARLENGALAVQIHNWAGVAMWIPPTLEEPKTEDSNIPGPIVDYRKKCDLLKKKILGTRRYWYLNLIARTPGRQDKGAIRGLIEPFLERAQDRNIPVWLEATSKHSKEVYTHLGFRVVGEIVVGTGVVNHEGFAELNGKGITVWAMTTSLSQQGDEQDQK